MNIQEKMNINKDNLAKAIESNPSFVSHEKGVVSVIFARYADKDNKQNPPLLVLEHNLGLGECKASDIAELIEQRRAFENREITLSSSTLDEIGPKLKSGEMVLNEDFINAIYDMDSTIVKYKKAIDSPLIDWLAISDNLEKRGMNFSSINEIRDKIIPLAREAIVLNTEEDGKCPLGTTKNLTDHILSKQGQIKIAKNSPHLVDSIVEINKLIPRENEYSHEM